MKKIHLILVVFCLSIAFLSCKNKPKPVSSDVTKQVVKVNGEKDSIINNPRKNYGNATISEPCVRCMIEAVESSMEYKQLISKIHIKDVKYKINWIKADGTVDTTNTKGATNAIKLDITKNNVTAASFVYDNSAAKLFFMNKIAPTDKKETTIDETKFKKIRNACYWGVASSK